MRTIRSATTFSRAMSAYPEAQLTLVIDDRSAFYEHNPHPMVRTADPTWLVMAAGKARPYGLPGLPGCRAEETDSTKTPARQHRVRLSDWFKEAASRQGLCLRIPPKPLRSFVSGRVRSARADRGIGVRTGDNALVPLLGANQKRVVF